MIEEGLILTTEVAVDVLGDKYRGKRKGEVLIDIVGKVLANTLIPPEVSMILDYFDLDLERVEKDIIRKELEPILIDP